MVIESSKRLEKSEGRMSDPFDEIYKRMFLADKINKRANELLPNIFGDGDGDNSVVRARSNDVAIVKREAEFMAQYEGLQKRGLTLALAFAASSAAFAVPCAVFKCIG